MKSFLDSIKFLFLGILMALASGSLIFWCAGESPGVLFEALRNSLFTPFGLGYTLFYTTPLILTGLSVALSFRVGLFNIGAEGQLYLGTLSIIALAAFCPDLPKPIAWLFSFTAAALGGGLLGGFAGFLKAKRGSHEVIVTILLNFIAIAFVDYSIMTFFKTPETQNPETITVHANYFIPTFYEILGVEGLKSTPVNLVFLIAIALAILVYWFLSKTPLGYELRATGENPVASRFAGISISKNTMLAFFLSGALAGLVGLNEVNGHEHKLVQNFSPQYGFTGIAVALLARNHPITILFAALVFGTLQNSSRELEFLSNRISKELSLVLQGILVAFIASRTFIESVWLKFRRANV